MKLNRFSVCIRKLERTVGDGPRPCQYAASAGQRGIKILGIGVPLRSNACISAGWFPQLPNPNDFFQTAFWQQSSELYRCLQHPHEDWVSWSSPCLCFAWLCGMVLKTVIFADEAKLEDSESTTNVPPSLKGNSIHGLDETWSDATCLVQHWFLFPVPGNRLSAVWPGRKACQGSF